ncbi:PAS domain S-box-containing protein [Mucilaginibacter frigoritolerans]|uniref:histidine kinase n=1 Tax=Mucilaginibacter frigoritolerans TaxID=652788 RepID=A0A562UHG7_9SPHI|nr:PAS domain S-box protein [Mucilaginibacter frigoritolerans]TWJ04645.1 PAS domain S-box-containing protein [Mucilaginibacter frigoritolerans]
MNSLHRNTIIITISLITIVAAGIVMTDWVSNIPALQKIFPDFNSIKFNPALCFLLLGFALLFTQYNISKNKTTLFLILSSLTLIIGLITLSQDFFHFNSGLDQLFVFDKTKQSPNYPHPGRMAVNTSINFILMATGFLALTIPKRSFIIIAQFLFNLVTFLSAFALIGYSYGISLFYAIFYVNSMASHTAILFLILSIAASLLNPSIGITHLFTGKQVGNRVAKRFYVLLLIMVMLFGLMIIHKPSFSLFSSIDIEISILAILFLLISLLFIWNMAEWLNNIDKKRSDAEAEIKLINTQLEKRIEERTTAFQRSEEKYHSLIEQASDAIYVLDFNGNFTDVNDSMCKMMGYSRDELLKLNIEDIVDPDELKIDPLPKSMHNTGQSVIRERTFVTKNGQPFTVEINVKIFVDDRIMVIARDVTDRKKIEKELREAELKFRTIAEKSIVGVYIVQKNKFIYVNPRFAEIFDYTPKELINTIDIEIVFQESYRAIANEHVMRRMTGEVESVHYEAMGRKKNGDSNWVEFYGSRAIIGNEPTIIGSMIDVTERKKAEEELKSSEQKYKLLFDSNPMPMWMIAKDDQTVIDVNNAAANHYGYTKEEALKINIKTLRPEEDQEDQLEDYLQQMNYSDNLRVVKHLKKDGSIIYVNIIAYDIIFEGRPVRLSMTIDVTEKLKAEESLQKSEANLKAILNTTDTAYALFDIDLKVIAFNHKSEEFINEQYHHFPEKSDRLTDYFPKEKFPQFNSFSKEVLKGKTITYEIDYPQINGSVFWYDVRLFPITNDSKDIIGMLMSLYNITERKNAEQDLKSAYNRIQNHINSIKNMAWKQSHLVRSPLANLKGLFEMLKDEPSDTEVFDHIRTELHRMDNIIVEMAKEASDNEIIE